MGAVIIEKHFTLDRTLPGPDHAASLSPEELKQMVKAIRNIELAISGSGIKEPSESELKNITIARKSIYINKDLPSGHILADDDLIALRPGDGISAMQWNNVIGKETTLDLQQYQKITWSNLK
jgi:N-acetylneuraminate synthase/N,N'-diacetyllegionaminate synthase